MKYLLKNKLILVLFLALSAAGCINRSGQSRPVPAPLPWQTFHYVPYNFEFKYSPTWSFTKPQEHFMEEPIVSVITPDKLYPGTNFSEATFTVSAGVAVPASKCFSSTQGDQPLTESVEINGHTFYTENISDAGAGNFYESQIYRTMSGQVCLEIIQRIHTTNVGNYEPGTIEEVDKTGIKAILKDILNSFKIISA